MLNLVYIHGYKLNEARYADWIFRMPFIIQGTHRDVVDLCNETPPNQFIPFDDKLFGQGRWQDDVCDFGLFQEWPKVCETKHNHHTPKFTDDMAIRLIDVQRKCLIEYDGPTPEAPRFVALSYVWGGPQVVMLTTDKLNEFKKPGFLDRTLGYTIQDSIDLVSKMGEKYLWVVALCILQDSAEDQARQIPQMHKIYGVAILTIVAAAGDNANFGLPGVVPRTRTGNRFRLELEEIQVLFRSHTKLYAPPGPEIGFSENYLAGLKYQSRAWTYQEGYLSTRVLVFTKDQVYFECEKCTWCEETHWESDTVDFVSWRAVKDPTPTDIWTDRFERKAYDILGDDELEKPEPPRNSYASLVKQYSNRDLTDDKDVLSACTGVLSSIKEREQSDFFFALRTEKFGNDLLFNIMKAVPSRFSDRASVECRFPTWSWLSWKGTIEVANEPRYDSYDAVDNLVPCDGVRCWTLDMDNRGKKSLRVINKTGGWRFQQNYVRKGEGIYDPAELHIPERRSPQHEDSSDAEEDPQPFGTPGDVRQELLQDQSDPTTLPKTPVPPGSAVGSSKTTADIPEYSQDVSLADLESHPAFSQIEPNFHIIFSTFFSMVVLRTEYDEMSILMSKIVIAGTKKTRGGGVWENRDEIQRKIYACKEKEQGSSPSSGEVSDSYGTEMEDEPCPCCGKVDALPDGIEQGPYLGRLPPLSTSWNSREYINAIPDGVYRLLWMNNNQLPMFGHLLCKPVSESASNYQDWDGEILQRVCGVVGPIDILSREQQEKYLAKWGTFVLG